MCSSANLVKGHLDRSLSIEAGLSVLKARAVNEPSRIHSAQKRPANLVFKDLCKPYHSSIMIFADKQPNFMSNFMSTFN